MKFHRFDEPGKVKLADISEEPPDGYSKHDAKRRFEELSEEIFELQDWMWGAKTHSVLLILQGFSEIIKRIGFLLGRIPDPLEQHRDPILDETLKTAVK